jgi:hypothetical protein
LLARVSKYASAITPGGNNMSITQITTAGPGWIAIYGDGDIDEGYGVVAAWTVTVLGYNGMGGIRTAGLSNGDDGVALIPCESIPQFVAYLFCPACFKDGLCMKHGG